MNVVAAHAEFDEKTSTRASTRISCRDFFFPFITYHPFLNIVSPSLYLPAFPHIAGPWIKPGRSYLRQEQFRPVKKLYEPVSFTKEPGIRALR
jgi:hypothetical protein